MRKCRLFVAYIGHRILHCAWYSCPKEIKDRAVQKQLYWTRKYQTWIFLFFMFRCDHDLLAFSFDRNLIRLEILHVESQLQKTEWWNRWSGEHVRFLHSNKRANFFFKPDKPKRILIESIPFAPRGGTRESEPSQIQDASNPLGCPHSVPGVPPEKGFCFANLSCFLVAPCCCKERLYLPLCDVICPVVHGRTSLPPWKCDFWAAGQF